MTDLSERLPKNLSASFADLKEAASELNDAAKTLAEPIEAFNAALKQLNLGIPAWEPYATDEDHPTGDWSRIEIGYAKIGGQWGVALRRLAGNYRFPGEDTCDSWLFNDAPRRMRIEAVEHLPKVIEALLREARSTAAQITEKVGQAERVAEAIAGVQKPPAVSKAHPPVRPVTGSR